MSRYPDDYNYNPPKTKRKGISEKSKNRLFSGMAIFVFLLGIFIIVYLTPDNRKKADKELVGKSSTLQIGQIWEFTHGSSDPFRNQEVHHMTVLDIKKGYVLFSDSSIKGNNAIEIFDSCSVQIDQFILNGKLIGQRLY